MPLICLIPGDGVGQEVIPVAAEALRRLIPNLEFVEAEAGWHCFQRHGTALPAATLAAVASADATLFGATQSPSEVVPGYASPILTLRRHFDLYANLRPTRSLLPDSPPVDLLIVRENTEGLYSGRERQDGDEAVAERVITRRASQRIAHVAFAWARRRASHRPSVTVVHKANVLKLTDGLFRRACQEVAAGYPDVELREMLVDAAAMWLVKDPARFDVLLTTNLFGDILSDLAAGLVGGLGVAPSANVGAGRVAIFEPVHGSAPDITGRGVANPTGALLSAVLLLEHVGEKEAAATLEAAVETALANGVRTPDLGGEATTAEMAATMLAQLPRPAKSVRKAQHTAPDIELLRGLLAIPSLSGREGAAVSYLVDWMRGQGFEAFVDAAGNAVGVLDGGPGPDGSPPREIVLLGHIDTVAGSVPVRLEDGKLFGRGAVDAKGPLAAFATAAAGVGAPTGWRLVVIGAVEEEAATSKGAREAAGHFKPDFCIIGEPSGWDRVTLGYKGRLLADVTVRRQMSHTAGPATSAPETAVVFWNLVAARIEELNRGRARAWDQVLPSLRSFQSASDGLIETARMTLGFRLPPDVGPDILTALLTSLAEGIELSFTGAEMAFEADKNTPLVRAFLSAIREQDARPGFVLKTGTSDMNVVGPVWSRNGHCPILAYGPGDSSLDHTPFEHVEIAEWQRGVAVLTAVLRRLTGSN